MKCRFSVIGGCIATFSCKEKNYQFKVATCVDMERKREKQIDGNRRFTQDNINWFFMNSSYWKYRFAIITPLRFDIRQLFNLKLNTACKWALSAIFLFHHRYPYNPFIRRWPLNSLKYSLTSVDVHLASPLVDSKGGGGRRTPQTP